MKNPEEYQVLRWFSGFTFFSVFLYASLGSNFSILKNQEKAQLFKYFSDSQVTNSYGDLLL